MIVKYPKQKRTRPSPAFEKTVFNFEIKNAESAVYKDKIDVITINFKKDRPAAFKTQGLKRLGKICKKFYFILKV